MVQLLDWNIQALSERSSSRSSLDLSASVTAATCQNFWVGTVFSTSLLLSSTTWGWDKIAACKPQLKCFFPLLMWDAYCPRCACAVSQLVLWLVVTGSAQLRELLGKQFVNMEAGREPPQGRAGRVWGSLQLPSAHVPKEHLWVLGAGQHCWAWHFSMDARGRHAGLAGRWQAVFHSSDSGNEGCKIFRLNFGSISTLFTAKIIFSCFLKKDILILKVEQPTCSTILLAALWYPVFEKSIQNGMCYSPITDSHRFVKEKDVPSTMFACLATHGNVELFSRSI